METNRECGTCTKCCEGWVSGSVLGHTFYKGKPCHFIAIGKGCSIYAKRPEDPCVKYSCGWLKDADLPEWMKPSEINAIIDFRTVTGTDIQYIRIHEAGEPLRADVLSWMINYAISKNYNLYWTIKEANYWQGTPEFCKSIAGI